MRFPLACTLLSMAALPLVAGCEGSTASPQPSGPPGITIVSGGGVQDSIQADVAPLVVEVRDEGGHLMPNVAVQFTASLVPGTSVPAMYLRTDEPYDKEAFAHTDQAGRATVNVALGAKAGPATVLVSVRSPRLSATVPYEVRPGARACRAAPSSVTTAERGVRTPVNGVGFPCRSSLARRSG